MRMYKCKGKNCPAVVEGKDRLKHVEEVHPRFYNLVKVSAKERAMNDKMPEGLFEYAGNFHQGNLIKAIEMVAMKAMKERDKKMHS